MRPGLRKFVFTTHVVLAVGWLGAVVAYMPLAIAGLKSQDPQMVRAAYLSMELIGWYVIIPLSLATLLTGLIQSLGTGWGLLRHYWISVKFALTVFAVFILLRHVPNKVSHVARLAADPSFSPTDLGNERFGLVLHPALGLLVLLINTVLSIYKPWGMTPYGRRKQEERRAAHEVHQPDVSQAEVSQPVPVAGASASGESQAHDDAAAHNHGALSQPMNGQSERTRPTDDAVR